MRLLTLLSSSIVSGSGSASLGRATGSGVGSVSTIGAGAGSVGKIVGLASGSPEATGAGAGSLRRVLGAASGAALASGTGAGTIGRIVAQGYSSPAVAALPLVTGPVAVLDDIVARLVATGAFGTADGTAEVGWGANLETLFPDASHPSASVEYLGSSEETISDIDFMVRDGRYALTLAVRSSDPRDRGADLSQLSAVARNALSNVRLGGFCQPYFSRLKEDAPANASLPGGRVRLLGSFRYTIADDASRDEADDF